MFILCQAHLGQPQNDVYAIAAQTAKDCTACIVIDGEE